MDLLVILMIVGSIVSSLMKYANRQQQGQQAGRPDPRRPKPTVRQVMRQETQRPERPVAFDPPEQTEMPTQWDGEVEWTTMVPTIAVERATMVPTVEWTEGEGGSYTNLTPIQPSKLTAQQALWQAREQEAQPAVIPALDLAFDGDALVKGVIYAEILGRR